MLSRLSSTILIPFLVFASLLLGALFGYRMGFFAPTKTDGSGWFYDEVFFQIEENFVDDIDIDQYKTTGAKGIVESIPHGEYYSIEEAERESQSFEGRYEGIGIQFAILEDTIFVVNTLRGGPSERLGIQSADRIVAVEGKNVAGIGITQDSVVSLLMGPRNTRVNVSVMRRDSVFPLSIQRGSIATPTVSLSYMVDASVGYVQVDMFGAYTHEEFSRAIESLQKQGMTKLIVDLRNNGGGYLDQAIKMLDECIEDNRLLLYTEGRKRKRKDYFSTRPGVFEDGELVVLTNSMSASASEIFAGAIQDWDRGLVIGQRTFGKGLVQEEFTLSNGDVMRLPVSKYYMPSGRCVQKPYKGKDAYEYGLEIVDRFESEEIVDSSAIQLEDSTEYFTLIEGRTVYGGGGVIPDVFIPIDTGRIPFSRTYLRNASYSYFSKYREDVIGQWKDNAEAFFADSNWALRTILDDTTIAGLTKDDRLWANSSLQNLYAGMIWMGNKNRIALHKVDKHFQEAKRVLKQYEYALYNSRTIEDYETTGASIYRGESEAYAKEYSLQPFWIRMGLLGAATLLLGGLLFSRGSSKV